MAAPTSKLGIWNFFHLGPGSADFLFAGIARGAGAIFAFVANIIIARLLGAPEFGIYITILSAAIVAGVAAGYGVGPLLVREIAARPIGERGGFLWAIGLWAARVTGTLCILSTAAVMAWLSSGHGSPNTAWIERLAVLGIIPMYLAVILVRSVLAGLHEVGKSQAIETAIKNGLLLLGVGLLLIVGVSEVAAVLWLQVASLLVAGAVGAYWVMRKVGSTGVNPSKPTPPVVGGGNQKALRRSWFTAATHFFSMSVALLLLIRLDVVIVNAVAGSIQAGLFGAAARLGQLGIIAGMVWIAWLQPRMARQSRSRNKGALKRSLRVGTVGSAGMTAVLAILGWWLAPRLMHLMGSGFGGAVWPFRWLLLGYLVWGFSVPFDTLLAMSGHEKTVSRILWFQLIVTLAAGATLGEFFGALGAAWAWAGGAGVTGILMMIAGFLVIREPVLQDA